MPEGEIKDAQVISAQSFGFRNSDPGLSNKAIAEIVWNIAQKRGLPMILQWEVAYALPDEPDNLTVIRSHRIKGEYLDTMEVLSQTKEIMGKQRWEKAIVVAHPSHIWRVKKMFEKMGVKIIIPSGLRDIPFDPQSEQWWTRNIFFWILREIPVRLICLAKGWI